MVLQYFSNAGDEGAKRDSIYEYLKDVLPAHKTEEQQLRYVGRLLVELNEEKLIDRIGLKWILTDNIAASSGCILRNRHTHVQQD